MKRGTSQIAAAAAVALLTGLTSTLPGHAATQEEQDHACRGDAFHFCASEIPNKEKIEACMKQHYSELSPPCKAMFGKKPKGQ
jgi:hypothetical protein